MAKVSCFCLSGRVLARNKPWMPRDLYKEHGLSDQVLGCDIQNTNKQEQETKLQIYNPNQEAKSTCGDSHSKGRGMSENTKYYKNCQLFKAELVKMNWKVSNVPFCFIIYNGNCFV